MKTVEFVYVDAQDGRSVLEFPPRHGPKLPRDDIEIDAIDRTKNPTRFYGRVPDDAELDGKAIWEIDESTHENAVTLINNRSQNIQLNTLASYRYDLEVGGVTVDGYEFHTDRESQPKLSAARLAAKEGRTPKVWKLKDGQFLDVDADYMVKLTDEIFNFIDELFVYEKELSEKILKGEKVNIRQGWPSTERFTDKGEE